ncbi:hypothetical protein [Chryseobacterium indologenes]|uniref:hypothetical protein n=1 Tax=Chryseobacterium indologenes TaxID=253 RepID=UPI0011AB4A89|nr:hypothetical protein [Chryseobacterium indologenes]
MEFKSFLTSSNIEEERVKFASMEAENKALDNDIRCIKCKSNQNVKLALLSENGDERQSFLCENCRKASFKVKIFR